MTRNISKSREFFFFAIVLISFFIYQSDCHGHVNEESPAFKYSRAANENRNIDNLDHGHDHHGHDHHGHDHHGHDHHEHDHHEHDHHEHDHHEHDHHGHDHHGHEEKMKISSQYKNYEHKLTRSKLMIALYACGSTLLISIAPFIILFFIPLNNNGVENQSLLKILLGFASGSLLGDAFLHLIPHALSPHNENEEKSHSHSHSVGAHDHSKQTIVGLSILAGLMAFLLVEKLVRNFKGGEHAHAHAITINDKNDDNESKDKKGSDKCEIKSYKINNEIKVAGYLNLAADFSHNFTDGLAIGASFLAGQNIGFITTLTILFHEVPHEIGDFAVLIQSGCSKQKAIFLQLFTALGALSGTLISLLFESAISGIANSFILPFTAGGFIYIATVSIIPELKESTGLKQSAKEIIALIAGVGMMVIIAYIE